MIQPPQRDRRERPDDFEEILGALGIRAARDHYGCSWLAIERWQKEVEDDCDTVAIARGARQVYVNALVESSEEDPYRVISKWVDSIREADLDFLKRSLDEIGAPMTESEEISILRAYGKVRAQVLDAVCRRVREEWKEEVRDER